MTKKFNCGHRRDSKNSAPTQYHGRKGVRCRKCHNAYMLVVMRRKRRVLSVENKLMHAYYILSHVRANRVPISTTSKGWLKDIKGLV